MKLNATAREALAAIFVNAAKLVAEGTTPYSCVAVAMAARPDLTLEQAQWHYKEVAAVQLYKDLLDPKNAEGEYGYIAEGTGVLWVSDFEQLVIMAPPGKPLVNLDQARDDRVMALLNAAAFIRFGTNTDQEIF